MSLVPAFILGVPGGGHALCSSSDGACSSRTRKVAWYVCLSLCWMRSRSPYSSVNVLPLSPERKEPYGSCTIWLLRVDDTLTRISATVWVNALLFVRK